MFVIVNRRFLAEKKVSFLTEDFPIGVSKALQTDALNEDMRQLTATISTVLDRYETACKSQSVKSIVAQLDSGQDAMSREIRALETQIRDQFFALREKHNIKVSLLFFLVPEFVKSHKSNKVVRESAVLSQIGRAHV